MMQTIETRGCYQFSIIGPQEEEAAAALRKALKEAYTTGFDVCDTLPRVREEIEATMQACIVAHFL